MTSKRQTPTGNDAKAARLKAALKANIARRKEQAKARSTSTEDEAAKTEDEE